MASVGCRVRRRQQGRELARSQTGGPGEAGWVPVRLLMGLARSGVREGLAALPAGEGLLTRVDSDVPLEVPRVRELLPTVLWAQQERGG
jgi:hypothetical protein